MAALNFIYGLIDPRTGYLRYVGQTSVGMKRPLVHAHASVLRVNANPHKCNWVRQLLQEGLSYEIEVLEELEAADQLNDAEVFWVSYMRSIGAHLLNAAVGGGGVRGFKHSEKTRKKLSESHKGQLAWNKGKPARPEEAARLRTLVAGNSFRKGAKHTEDARKKMSDSARSRPRAPHSEETRLNISKAHKGKGKSLETRLKMAKAKVRGKVIDQNGVIYDSAIEAARSLDLGRSAIYKVLAGERKTVKGYVFKYVEDVG